MTPAEVGRLLRVSPDKVRGWIARGELRAVNLGSNARPRLVVLPHHLAEFERKHLAAPARKPARKRRRKIAGETDFYPD